jgi:hypothetical protein
MYREVVDRGSNRTDETTSSNLLYCDISNLIGCILASPQDNVIVRTSIE